MRYRVTFDRTQFSVLELTVEAASAGLARAVAIQTSANGNVRPTAVGPVVSVRARMGDDDGQPRIDVEPIEAGSVGTPSPDDPTNAERASRVARVLRFYVKDTAGGLPREPDDDQSDMAALLADCMHYCDGRDISFESVLALAHQHHIEERPQEGHQE